MKCWSPETHPFETVMVDLTHRCNMACANCYLPNRSIPDMDKNTLFDCISRFPRRTNIRLAGAEPTLRHDLPEIIMRIIGLGHRVVLLTNGLKLARASYVNALRQAGLRHVYISMNGVDRDDWYQQIDNLACAEKKLQAVRNVITARMVLNTGTILIRGINEGGMQRLINIISQHHPRHALLRFKNIGALGRYDHDAEAANLTMADMEMIARKATGHDINTLRQMTMVKGYDEPTTRLFPVVEGTPPARGIWIKLTDWQADGKGMVDHASQRRGRITPQFTLAPFFDHIKAHEGGF